MALTVTDTKLRLPFRTFDDPVEKSLVIYEVTFDSSYASGGEPVGTIITDVGDVDTVDALIPLSVLGGYIAEYDGTDLSLYWDTDPGAVGGANIPFTEVDATTDVSAVVVTVLVIGDAA